MDLDFLKKKFSDLGFEIIYFNGKPSANGVDIWVQKKNRRPLSVEIKTIRKHKKGVFRIDPVSEPRKGDDLIAIIVNEQYVLIESMVDHLRSCSPSGTRQMTLLCSGGV